MTPRAILIAGAAAAALGLVLVWTLRAVGGACVSGEADGEPFDACVDWDSATGAVPATIGILVLAAVLAAVAFRAPASRRRVLVPVLLGLIVLVAVAGVAVNLLVVDYPAPYYPG